MARTEGHTHSSSPGPAPRRRAPNPQGASHPTGKAALLLVGVTALIVVLALLSSLGHV